MLQSSSPNALLTASLDAARQQMATQGREHLDRTIRLAQHARDCIRQIPGLWCYGEELAGEYGVFACDPTKLVVRVHDTGLNGQSFAARMEQQHNIYGEFVDPKHIIYSVTMADGEADVDMLIGALRAVAQTAVPGDGETNLRLIAPPDLPVLALNPRQAAFAHSKSVRLEQAIGEVCAEQIMPYPPGVPLLLPGEIIDREMVKYLAYIKTQRIKIVGPEDVRLEHVRIIVSEL
jgi:arginine/lysine/ornithine decarboxylase